MNLSEKDGDIVGLLLQLLVFSFWIGIGFYFYKQDTKTREEQVIEATKIDIRKRKNKDQSFVGLKEQY